MSAEKEGQHLIAPWKILDLTGPKGAFCGRILGDLGADVFGLGPSGKRNEPGQGSGRPDRPGNRDDRFLWQAGLGKKNITLNLDQRAARPLFLKMACWADVVIEDRPPGWLEAHGLGYEVLNRANPRLVLASITPFGSKGAGQNHKATDETLAACSGQSALSGRPDGPPRPLAGRQTYLSGSLFAAIGILAALRRRNQTGQGDRLELSLQACAAAVLEHALPRFNYDRITAKRTGRAHWNDEFALLPCRDGWFLLTPFQNWEALTALMSAEGAAQDLTRERYLDPVYRRSQKEHVLAVVAAWVASKTKEELFESSRLLRLPWGPALSPEEAVGSPQLKEREFIQRYLDRDSGEAKIRFGLPVRFTGPAPSGRSGPARSGDDNSEFYLNRLGLPKTEFERLREEGVI